MAHPAAARGLRRRIAAVLAAILVPVTLAALPAGARGDDWPTYRHDYSRSGITEEPLEFPLRPSWVFRSPWPPRMAWPGPAKWDGWHKIRGLEDRMTFDRVFHVAVADGAVYFGSSVDDRVRCLDAATGDLRWVFSTEGPVRLAPTVVGGRVYVGSDDGRVYCLDARDGTLVWERRPGPSDLRVAGNERVISPWAVRTGVIVLGGEAYCGAGVFPSEKTYICALDAGTGEKLRQTVLADVPAQGYMLASPSRLYVATGRERPLVLDRTTGKRLYQIEGGGGGTYALLTGDTMFYGPGKTGEISVIDRGKKDQLAVFKGIHMIVTADRSYLHTRRTLASLDRRRYIEHFTEAKRRVLRQREIDKEIEKLGKGGAANADRIAALRQERERLDPEIARHRHELEHCSRWKVPCDSPFDLILTANALVAGGPGTVVAHDTESGKVIWRAQVSGNVFGLAAAGGRLLASTDDGAIHCFAPGLALDPVPPAGAAAQAAAEHESPAPASRAQPEPDVPPRWEWTFDRDHVRGDRVAAARGGLDGAISSSGADVAEGRVISAGRRQALVLDGTRSITVSRQVARAGLPAGELTVEARVLVLETPEWSGFASAIQDNGDLERGFLLGTRRGRFCFAVASAGTRKLTYLTAPAPLETGRWYHVAGTYDGNAMALFVDGRLEARSTAQSGPVLYPKEGTVELAAYRDKDEFHPVTGLLGEVAIHDRALTEAEVRRRAAGSSGGWPAPPREIFGPFDTIVGPFAEFTGPDTIRIEWRTDTPASSIIEIGTDPDRLRRFEDPAPKTAHAITVPGIEHDALYHYRIRGEKKHGDGARTAAGVMTELFTFDASFNYVLPAPLDRPCPYPDDRWTALAEATARRILAASGAPAGYCLVVGCDDGRLAYFLARRSRLQVIVVEADAARVDRARRLLDAGGVYGARVTVHRRDTARLEYGRYLADIVTSESMLRSGRLPAPLETLYRVLRPSGGLLALGTWTAAQSAAPSNADVASWAARATLPGGEALRSVSWKEGSFWTLQRAALPGAGEWTHQYGAPDNTSCDGDELVRGELSVLWWGRPGPRPMPDRGPRNPAPVSAGGRLYVQGDRTLFGLDAYNGAILWAKQIPPMRRANVPRDSSNMVATRDGVLVAIADRCVGFDGDSGRVVTVLETPPAAGTAGKKLDWGYLAHAGGLLLGSATLPDSRYIGDAGEWYEGFSRDEIARVTSRALFATRLEDIAHAGKPGGAWTYTGGVILNSTISAGEASRPDGSKRGTVFFIESRSPAALESETGRLFEDVQSDQYLVALDLETGEKLHETYFDFSRCQFMTYLAYAGDTLLVTGSDRAKRFHTYAFDARTGKLLWEDETEAKKTHHSGHLMHPVIVGNRVFLNKHTYDLRTGKVLRFDPFDFHGCGAMSASAGAIFHRFEYHGMLDLETGKRTEFTGIRGGCWLGQIPAGGLLLAPETSSGCSCTHSLQISVGFAPRER